jgi:hypothetical protein
VEAKRRIILEDRRPGLFRSGDAGPSFRVKKVVNSIEFTIGELVTSQRVRELVDDGWTVNIVKERS